MTDAPATRDAPWPVALLSGKLNRYLDRLGTVWVEGEITQWGISGGNVYGKLKDLDADATLSFQVWSSVRARLDEQFKPGVIGLITGKDSDAENDVLRNARLRWPAVEFRVVHAAMQGDRTAAEVV